MKAINWAKEFYYEVLSEDTDSAKTALRIGSLYYDTGYYCIGEKVDIRVDHKVVRKAQIVDDMKLFSIKDLPESVIANYKSTLKDKNQIINFLSQNYNQHVDENTAVTVIVYRNLPKDDIDDVDDPHM